MKKILLTLLIYIAYCIFVQCENDKLQESLVIATILSIVVFITIEQPKLIRNIRV